jgi:hypothetical protein
VLYHSCCNSGGLTLIQGKHCRFNYSSADTQSVEDGWGLVRLDDRPSLLKVQNSSCLKNAVGVGHKPLLLIANVWQCML